jgi:3-phenylpropionate/cinnamic acid dioxygenase small subunit
MLPTPEDHAAISHLLARYCLTLDHDDVDGWVALFTPDATYQVYGRSFDGHEGLRRMMTGAPGGHPSM